MGLFLDDREDIISLICWRCKHLKEFRKCKAFQDKDIPLSIWNGDNEHRLPFKGDNGIQFEEIGE